MARAKAQVTLLDIRLVVEEGELHITVARRPYTPKFETSVAVGRKGVNVVYRHIYKLSVYSDEGELVATTEHEIMVNWKVPSRWTQQQVKDHTPKSIKVAHDQYRVWLDNLILAMGLPRFVIDTPSELAA